MLWQPYTLKAFLTKGSRFLLLLLLLLGSTPFVVGYTDQESLEAPGSMTLTIDASGKPCQDVVGQLCIIKVGDTLIIGVTAKLVPPVEPVSLSAQNLPPSAEFPQASGIGVASSTFRFTPTAAGEFEVLFIAVAGSGKLVASLTVSIRVVTQAEAVPATEAESGSTGQTPVIELPSIGVTAQKFTVILKDCATNQTLRNTDAIFTPTKDPATGKIKTMAISIEGYETRILTDLKTQELHTSAGLFNITIIIYTASDGPLTEVLIPLLGTVKVGTICLRPLTPDIEIAPLTVDFGSVLLGALSEPKTITIRNVGRANLLVNSVVLEREEPPFELAGGEVISGFTLEPGGAVTLPTSFSPTSPDSFTNSVLIRSNDPDEPTVTVTLRGQVQAPPPAVITGFKFHDLNGDGKWVFTDTSRDGRWDPGEPGEPGIKDWTITLIGPQGPESPARQTTTTDQFGRFEFTVPRPATREGVYTLSEEQRVGWVQTAPRCKDDPAKVCSEETRTVRPAGATGVEEGPVLFGNQLPCTITVEGRVEDGTARHYPISKSKVWLFDIGNETLPIKPLSEATRRTTAETSTNDTNEKEFTGLEFQFSGVSTYKFKLERQTCPPRIVVVSLLWYDQNDLMAVSSEQSSSQRFVPIYLAKCVTPSTKPEPPCQDWKGGPTAYTATVDFAYGKDPTTANSARVIGELGRTTSERWDKNGREPVDDEFMRGSAHHYFYAYKAMRYFQGMAQLIAVPPLSLKPVVVSMFTTMGTATSPVDVAFGKLTTGSPTIIADARVRIENGDSAPPFGGEKPDNSIWHELGHYWWLQIYQQFFHGVNESHRGYINNSTTDSLQEGFAEFTSVLIAEHYGDPKPFFYRLRGNNVNLETDEKLRGPLGFMPNPAGGPPATQYLNASGEEFAIAGLLWDLHDGGDAERKLKGAVSFAIQTEDVVSLIAKQIFEIFYNDRPTHLKAVFDSVEKAYPKDSDVDGVSDIGEIFIAHGAYDDVGPRNFAHDAGETIGLSGDNVGGRAWGIDQNGRWNWQPIPARARQQAPIIPHAHLQVRIVDVNGQDVDVTTAIMRIAMRFDFPFSYYDYDDERSLTSNRVYFVMPSDFYPVKAFITIEVPGVGQSDPLVLSSEEYWNLFERAIDVGTDYLLEHAFIVKPTSFFFGATLEKDQFSRIEISQEVLNQSFLSRPGIRFEDRPKQTSEGGLQSDALTEIGLQLDPNTGVISGTPTQTGVFLIWIEVLAPDSKSIADIWVAISVIEKQQSSS